MAIRPYAANAMTSLLLEKLDGKISEEELVRVRDLLREREGDALIVLEAHRQGQRASLDLAERAFRCAVELRPGRPKSSSGMERAVRVAPRTALLSHEIGVVG
jgi:hypothetical protein